MWNIAAARLREVTIYGNVDQKQYGKLSESVTLFLWCINRHYYISLNMDPSGSYPTAPWANLSKLELRVRQRHQSQNTFQRSSYAKVKSWWSIRLSVTVNRFSQTSISNVVMIYKNILQVNNSLPLSKSFYTHYLKYK